MRGLQNSARAKPYKQRGPGHAESGQKTMKKRVGTDARKNDSQHWPLGSMEKDIRRSVVPQVRVKCRMIDERPILTGLVRSTSATPQLDMEFLGRRDQGSANVVSQSAGHHESDMQLSSLDASDRFTRKE